ncbi:MAG: YSC84-related protein [Pseudomonadota bacterium]
MNKTMGLSLLAAFAMMVTLASGAAWADSATEIETNTDAALAQFRAEIPGGSELAAKARGILVFPRTLKGGFVVAGEYGEGALREGGITQGYYSLASGSIGFQIGAQVKSVLIFFMTDEALTSFKNSAGWQVGADASVALITEGIEGGIDSDNIRKPIIGFVIGQKGLMAGVSIEGAKITRIER